MKKVLLFCAMLILSITKVFSIDEQTATELSEFIVNYVTDLVYEQDPTQKVEITIPKLENRVNLSSCDGFLSAELVKKDLNRRANSLKLKCDDPENGWDSIVPIRIKYLKPVVVALTPISKGEQFSNSNIGISYIDSLNLRGNFFVSPEKIIGARSKREIRSGDVIKNNQMCMVCKDDLVDLEAGTEKVTIKIEGKALEDGSLNDSIKVLNTRSQKVVLAKVIGVGIVRINVK